MRKIIILFALILIITGCGLKNQINQNLDIKQEVKRNVLMVIAPVDFRDVEYNDSRKIFEDQGYNIKVASIQKRTSVGTEGTKVNIDQVVGEVDPSGFDAIVFVGGPGMLQIIADDTLQITANKFFKAGKVVAAICVSPAILARAGMLKDKNATSYIDVKKDLEDSGAKFLNDAVVQDGIIITANGPEATKEFAQKIVNNLK